jgi:hypothetical protein
MLYPYHSPLEQAQVQPFKGLSKLRYQKQKTVNIINPFILPYGTVHEEWQTFLNLY